MLDDTVHNNVMLDSCGMLVPRVCDGSALGWRKADIDITDIFKSGGSDLEEAELTLADKELAQTRLS